MADAATINGDATCRGKMGQGALRRLSLTDPSVPISAPTHLINAIEGRPLAAGLNKQRETLAWICKRQLGSKVAPDQFQNDVLEDTVGFDFHIPGFDN